jgi:hypothetical protein
MKLPRAGPLRKLNNGNYNSAIRVRRATADRSSIACDNGVTASLRNFGIGTESRGERELAIRIASLRLRQEEEESHPVEGWHAREKNRKSREQSWLVKRRIASAQTR